MDSEYISYIFFLGLVVVVFVLYVATNVHADQQKRQKARDADIFPAKCFAMLLKYVALGDRRIGDGEKLHIMGVVRQAFPGKLTEVELRLLVDHATPEYHQIGDFTTPFLVLPEETRRGLFDLIASVAEADGKATKSEKERLAAIQSAFGL